MGRRFLADHLHVSGPGTAAFRRIGSVFLFDQQRTGLSKPLSFAGGYASSVNSSIQSRSEGRNGNASIEPGAIHAIRIRPGMRLTSDPRLILTSLAMRAQVAQEPGATEKEDFARLK